MRVRAVTVEVYLRLRMNEYLTLNRDWVYTRLWVARMERQLMRMRPSERKLVILLAMGYRGTVLRRMFGVSKAHHHAAQRSTEIWQSALVLTVRSKVRGATCSII